MKWENLSFGEFLSYRVYYGPSPSANLAGIWKGDPLVPAFAGHHGLPYETRCARARQ